MKRKDKTEMVIVMPGYNEEKCIEVVVNKWTNLLEQLFGSPEKTQLLVVNDGSKDRTGEILDRLSVLNPYLQVAHQINQGHGKALINGYKIAIDLEPKWIFQVDSDDQFIPDNFNLLWAKRNESNFITGYRLVRHDALHRLILTKIVVIIIYLLFGVKMKDSNIPYRLMRASFLKGLLAQLPEPAPFAPNVFLAVLAKKLGQNLYEIPIDHIERKTGEVSIVKLGLIKVCWRSLKELIKFSRQKVKSV